MHVSVQEVQQWLEVTKLAVTDVDATLEDTFFNLVAGRLSARYDVASWTDETTTPKLVRVVVSMLIAAAVYNRSYAEQIADVSEVSYGTRLELSAMSLLGGLADGSTDLVGEEGTESDISGPVFWPTDMATTIAAEEGADADGAAVRAFSMGMRF